MASFLNSAKKSATDVRSFLREASSNNGVKYKAEQASKHYIFIPYLNIESIGDNGESTFERQLNAITGKVHEWTGSDDKYKAVLCLEGIVRKDETTGAILNDGTCPMCDRIGDAWEVYNYRVEIEKAKGLDEEKFKEAKRACIDQRKIKDATPYIYIVVAQFRMNKGDIIINSTSGLPEFDLKVMKMSTSRIEKIQKIVENSGMEFLGTEIIFDYPDTNDVRLLSGQCTTTPLMPQMKNSIIGKYQAVEAAIIKATEAFDWEGIEKSFPEWKGMETEQARIAMQTQFRQFDEWKTAQIANPDAKYLEYLTNPAGEHTRPALTDGVTTANAQVDPNNIFGDGGIDIKL